MVQDHDHIYRTFICQLHKGSQKFITINTIETKTQPNEYICLSPRDSDSI